MRFRRRFMIKKTRKEQKKKRQKNKWQKQER